MAAGSASRASAAVATILAVVIILMVRASLRYRTLRLRDLTHSPPLQNVSVWHACCDASHRGMSCRAFCARWHNPMHCLWPAAAEVRVRHIGSHDFLALPLKPTFSSSPIKTLLEWSQARMYLPPRPATGGPCDAEPRGTAASSSAACGPPQFAQIRTDRGSDDNPLWAYFDGITEGPVVDKWESYFDVYHRCRGQHFAVTPGCATPACTACTRCQPKPANPSLCPLNVISCHPVQSCLVASLRSAVKHANLPYGPLTANPTGGHAVRRHFSRFRGRKLNMLEIGAPPYAL